MRVKVDLVRPTGPRIVWNFIFEDDVHAIIDVTANDQRHLLLWIAPNLCLLFMQHIDHADRINQRRRICCGWFQRDGQRDGVSREEFPRSILRTQTPWTLFTGFRWLSALGTILSHMERLQPRSPTMVRGKGRTLSEVRTQPGKRQLAGLRIKCDRRPL